jgi:SAM-dependent methyltransferase
MQVWQDLRLLLLPRYRSIFMSRVKMRLLGMLRPEWRQRMYQGDGHHCPVCGSSIRAFMRFGLLPDEWCPVCMAMRRHRMLWLFLRERTDLFDGRPKRMLHIAPESALAVRLRQVPGLDYITADLSAPDVMYHEDITRMTFADDSFDVVACSHVLEHVPDDSAAMREFRRVLRPGGRAVIMVPYVADVPTDEDVSITDPAERERRFGQFDHVRYYGRDIVDRLEQSGFAVEVVDAAGLLDHARMERLQVDPLETLFYCIKP